MARQKLPQQKDDCIKCTLPEDGSYRHCMNCRNKAVEECRRLEAELERVGVEASEREQANDNIPLVSNSVCPKCGKSKITDIWDNQFRCNSCSFVWGK